MQFCGVFDHLDLGAQVQVRPAVGLAVLGHQWKGLWQCFLFAIKVRLGHGHIALSGQFTGLNFVEKCVQRLLVRNRQAGVSGKFVLVPNQRQQAALFAGQNQVEPFFLQQGAGGRQPLLPVTQVVGQDVDLFDVARNQGRG